ncbi:hypothetical protein M407DRAFT_21127 [Tulasnella calospora MUT 4182]|uniref:Retrotransposon gag domain-containing protein n=1 Tax=Tulasnella calospora MUT 4182 TaxID=1051891 RepID=A0A0C3QQA7_9AGAM|nr:hypothetical protein M407DRAFT_21127 [Tulasnella calospora MUT 4182]
MPKAAAQSTSKLSSKIIEYLQRLRDAHEEGEVAALVKPQYHYPKTNQVYAKVQYQQRNGKPYDFNKRITRATQHARINITKFFPSTPSSNTKVYERPVGTQQGTTGVQSSTSTPSQTTALPTQSTQPIQQPIVPTIDPNMLAAIMAALQMAGLGAQAPPQPQPKATKMKIKEPDTYDGKMNSQTMWPRFSSLSATYRAPGKHGGIMYILKDLLGVQLKKESKDWDAFKTVFTTAFGHPDKEGTAIRKLEALSQGNRPTATYAADF